MKIQKTTARALTAATLLFGSLAGGANAAIITFADPNAQTTQSSVDPSSPTSTAARTIDGSGLGSPYPTFPTTHIASNADSWLATAATGWLHYDFGTAEILDRVRIWNYNHSGVLKERGVRDVTIYTSMDAGAFGDNNHLSWTLLTTLDDITIGPDDADINNPYGEEFDLADTTARYVRFEITENWGNPANTGLAEVQFISVPEPSSFFLLGLGSLAVVLRRRR